MQDEHFREHRESKSEAAIAGEAGLTPETFRRIKSGLNERITIDNAIRLIQLFHDPHIADLFEFEDDEPPTKKRRGSSGNDTPSMDADSLVIAALGPTLKEEQKDYIKKLILFLDEHPEATLAEMIEAAQT
jgi:hypothetical protein